MKIAAVSFLNTIPLVEWFVRNDSLNVELTKALPSELSGLLVSGQVDVGLLPVVEVFRNNSSGILSGSCIGCEGPVDSVKLFVSGNLEDLKMVRADRGSRSSVALLKILLLEMKDLDPHFEETRPIPGLLPNTGEGVLVIGDLCFQYEKALEKNSDISVFDLGRWWFEMTGLPFVFAVWAASPDLPDSIGVDGIAKVVEMLKTARDFGMSILPELAKREASAGRIGYNGEATPEAIDYYFRQSLNYELGEIQIAGINEFYRLCQKHNLVPVGDMPPFL